MSSWFEGLVQFLTGDFFLTAELQSLGMGLQGALAVRNGRNKDKKMHPFHAFALSTIIAFGGGWMGFIWMGKPTSMITSGDINVTACVIAFIFVHYTPFDIGRKLGNFFPCTIVITSFAQLFRALGLMRFISVAFNELKDKPSPYYPIPVIGPILYGTLLGNMGSFLVKGFDGHLQDGIPWPFQNGFTMGTFFHLYAHDVDGPIGTFLRSSVKSVLGETPLGLDDRTFAMAFVSLFMQIVGFLQLPEFLGPSFSPWVSLWALIRAPMSFLLGMRSFAVASRSTPRNVDVKEANNQSDPANVVTEKAAGAAARRRKNKRQKRKTS